MTARERILARLRSAPRGTPPDCPDVAGWHAQRRRNEDLPQRVARLRQELENARAEVHETTRAQWPRVLLEIATAKGLRNLLVSEGVEEGFEEGSDLTGKIDLIRYEQPVESWRDVLFDGVDAALTRARSAIAETGSLILWPDAREPRLMSLVPPVHFVLLDAEAIHADFHSAMMAERWQEGLASNVLLISGPSKTADIQQTLAYGAHGPRELVVLLLHPQASMP